MEPWQAAAKHVDALVCEFLCRGVERFRRLNESFEGNLEETERFGRST
jgi:hypothetical protein